MSTEYDAFEQWQFAAGRHWSQQPDCDVAHPARTAMSDIEFEPVWECPFCYAENGESREVCWNCDEIKPSAGSTPTEEQP